MIKDISIATITWARTQDEETLLRRSLTALAQFQIPTFVTDGGSGKGFISFLKSFSNFTVLQSEEKGLWPQAKKSLSAAKEYGSKFILYTEPDKFIFFEQHLKTMLSTTSLNSSDGILLASRSAAGFSSYPAFQQMTETTINNCCTEITSKKFDYTYGPFFLSNLLIDHIHLIKEDTGWGWRPFMFCIASRLGLNISNYEEDFFCPADQQQDTSTERVYRMKQLEQNIRGIVLAALVSL